MLVFLNISIVLSLFTFFLFFFSTHTFCCRKAREVSCIIFVERIITAKVIERFLKKNTDLSHLTVSWLTGSNSSGDELALKIQRETLESFQCGKVSIYFTYIEKVSYVHVSFLID